MAAIILSIAGAVVLGTLAWLIVGPRIPLGEDAVQKQVINIFLYIGIAFLITFPIVVLLIGDLLG